MSYSEVIKNFNRIRDYMREFYVYGFKSRDEYTKKSGRSYDDERRRLESWLGDYMKFRQTPEGKNVFLSIDSRLTHHNPLYKAWKAKSFTDGDITLHFVLMDILKDCSEPLTLNEIADQVDVLLSSFDNPKTFDESTIRKKLKEYVQEGIIETAKKGKAVCYKRSESYREADADLLDFCSEVLPCGIIGSFLLDKQPKHKERLVFKHHYITGALDSEVLYAVFAAMREKRGITIETANRHMDRVKDNRVIPLQVMFSTQNGRQYLLAYTPQFNRISSYRLDNIVSVKTEEVSPQFDEFREKFEKIRPHIWGVSTEGRSGARMEHVDFTVRFEDDEQFIPARLEREKRCGTVEWINENTCRFSADVFDSVELIPWIRTFLCRITEIHFSDERIERQFKEDIEEMYRLYGMEDTDDLQ